MKFASIVDNILQAIKFRDELPKTNVGKILRRVLRDEEIAKRSVH